MSTTQRRLNGATIRAIRTLRGVSPADLAARVGISQPYLANIEAERRLAIDLNLRLRIAYELGVPYEAISYPVPDAAADAA